MILAPIHIWTPYENHEIIDGTLLDRNRLYTSYSSRINNVSNRILRVSSIQFIYLSNQTLPILSATFRYIESKFI